MAPIKPHEITLPGYLKKFIRSEFPTKGGRTVVSITSPLGRAAALSGYDKRLWKYRPAKSYYEKLTLLFEPEDIKINSTWLVISISRMFKEKLILWIQAQEDLGQPSIKACRSYLNHLKILKSEYSVSNAYKVWLRYNKIRKEREITA